MYICVYISVSYCIYSYVYVRVYSRLVAQFLQLAGPVFAQHLSVDSPAALTLLQLFHPTTTTTTIYNTPSPLQSEQKVIILTVARIIYSCLAPSDFIYRERIGPTAELVHLALSDIVSNGGFI